MSKDNQQVIFFYFFLVGSDNFGSLEYKTNWNNPIPSDYQFSINKNLISVVLDDNSVKIIILTELYIRWL